MRKRPSSRLLVLNEREEVLLFRFQHDEGPLAGEVFWSTPGGGVETGENHEEAARRELLEEVGLQVEHLGSEIAQRTAVFALPSGEMVEADERYFVVHAGLFSVDEANWSQQERQVIAAHRWWSHAELRSGAEQVWPENLAEMLVSAGVWSVG